MKPMTGMFESRVRLNCLLAVMLVMLPAVASAKSGVVRDVRLWTAPDHSRLVFDLNRGIDYHVFRLHRPERVVVDMKGVELKARLDALAIPDPVIASLRHGMPKAGTLRVVIDVKEKVQPRSFLLKPMHGKPYRLVVDLMRSQPQSGKAATRAMRQKKEIVIAVDAGHGGEDPGAIGRYGLYEKDVTLAVAKKLARVIDARPGMRAVLIRKGDYFIPLKKRVKLVRSARADMMISIHADAVRNRRVKGASVYTLSERGATPDKVAAALAAKENAADAVGGVMPERVEDPLVVRILGDMAKRDSLNSSQLLAEEILAELRRAGPVKYMEPKRARFVVLGALEIPSVLVELDYISNPQRERLLKSSRHQQQMAKAIFGASVRFFQRMGRIRKAEKPTHTVREGESLWLIARRYGVSMSELREINNLNSSSLRPGQKLRLPRS